MRSTFSTAIAALAAVASAQSTTSIDVDAISVAIPSSVFVLPVVYVTAEGAPTLTATTLASAEATPSSDPKATAVFDSPADVTAAISSASEAAQASATAVVKRDGTCVQQPLGISHVSLPDTAAAFAADPWYSVQATTAQVPAGFVNTFTALTASNSADQYVGFTLMSSYDPSSCAQKCSAMDGCNSFNIYFERDPQYDPSNLACANPASTVNVKCVFWGGAVSSANANNFGQMRDGFNVVIAGSNGYIANAFAAKLAVQATATSSSSAAASATDVAGNIYTIYYSSDSTQGAYSNTQASSSYTDCMNACDADSQCNAFTYVGGSNGVGSGTCWLKSQLGNPSSAGSNVLSGVRSGKAVSSSSSSVVSTSSSSSSSSASKTSTTASSTSSSGSSSVVPTSTSASSSSSSSTSASVAKTTSSSSSSSSSTATTMSTVTKSAFSSSSSASSTSTSTSASKTSTSTTTTTTPTPTPTPATTAQTCPWWNFSCWF